MTILLGLIRGIGGVLSHLGSPYGLTRVKSLTLTELAGFLVLLALMMAMRFGY